MKSGKLQRQTTLVEHPKDFQMSMGTVQMSAENFWMSIRNSGGVPST
jgi:hypothetical protein